MLGLPQSTVMRKPVPKQVLMDRSKVSSADRKRFDSDIHSVAIVGDISDKTVNLGQGKEVGRIAVIEVRLNTDRYSRNSISTIHKAINQRIVLVLRLDDVFRLAILDKYLFESDWQESEPELPLRGTDLDSVWENMVRHIGRIDSDGGVTLSDQIAVNQARLDLEDKISRLRTKMGKEKQHRIKREMYAELRLLEQELSKIKESEPINDSTND